MTTMYCKMITGLLMLSSVIGYGALYRGQVTEIRSFLPGCNGAGLIFEKPGQIQLQCDLELELDWRGAHISYLATKNCPTIGSIQQYMELPIDAKGGKLFYGDEVVGTLDDTNYHLSVDKFSLLPSGVRIHNSYHRNIFRLSSNEVIFSLSQNNSTIENDPKCSRASTRFFSGVLRVE